MHVETKSHLSEELLEHYSANTLAESDCAVVEEHLLVCSVCQERLDAADEYTQTMKLALQQSLLREKPEKASKRSWNWLFAGPALAAGCAAVMLAFLGPLSISHEGAVREVTLVATRGLDSGAAAITRPGRSGMTLNADVSDFPEYGTYSLRLVNAEGREIWTGTASPVGNQVTVHLTQKLAGGAYWVRLFSAGPSPALLREYKLEVQ